MKKLLLFACLLAVLAGCSKSNEPTNGVKDICGNTYPTVTIGTQVWMAENLKCNKYDNQSEAYKQGHYTIPTSKDDVFTPYYNDATDKSKWQETTYSGNLTDAQVAKLGYLYNWAAAVGVTDGLEVTSLKTPRQGICPNGWHVPSDAEWQTLYEYIYNDLGLTSNDVGKYLKTTSGWYSGEGCKSSTDRYGFAALPAGGYEYSHEHGLCYVGYLSYFLAATPDDYYSEDNHYIYLFFDSDLMGHAIIGKNHGQSVRCVKN